jgi:hypothetical protein
MACAMYSEPPERSLKPSTTKMPFSRAAALILSNWGLSISSEFAK